MPLVARSSSAGYTSRTVQVLALDQGTSATKALVVSSTDGIRGEAEVAVHPRTLADGGVEQDAEELWSSIVAAGRSAIAAAGGRIDAVALANQGETVVAWDRTTGDPLAPAVSWQDRRAVTCCDARRTRAERLRAVTGLPLDPYFAAPKITWLRERLPKADVITTTDSWLVHRLTGAYVTDAATASRTLLLDLDRGVWSSEACEGFGIDSERLPRIVGCAEPVGMTRAFGDAVPVAGLVVDQQAALFAEGCFAAGAVKCTYGTGAFLLATVGARPVRSRAGLSSSVAWRLGEATTYCLDGQVYTVGAALTWLTRIGLLDRVERLDIAVTPRSPDGALFVPALAGLGAPFWKPTARGALVGLTLGAGRGDLLRAAVDGIAAQVAELAGAVAVDVGRAITRLRVDGGLTRSAALMQAQADLLQAPVEIYPSAHATALGVAAFARLALGDAASVDDAVGAWSPAAVYEPRIGVDAAMEIRARWRRAVDAVTALA